MPPIPEVQPYLQNPLQSIIDKLKDTFSSFSESSGFSGPSIFITTAISITILVMAVVMLKRVLGNGSSSPGGLSPRAIRREARKNRRQGIFERAGELFEMAGDHEDAAEMYRRAQSYESLGHLYEVMKNWAAAAGAYEAASNVDKANEMYQKAGQFLKAAHILKDAKRDLSAASIFDRIGEHFEAARLYERSGSLEKAATSYERAQDFEKAARLYEKHFLQEKARFNLPLTANPSGSKSGLSAYARSSGRLYLKTGKADKAAKVFEAAGYFEDAAQAYIMIKDYGKAAELYHASNQFRKASELYRKADLPEKAHQILGEMFLSENNFLEAARMYEKGADFLQAGDLYEKADQVAKAAEMYQKGGDLSRANELFQSVGDPLSSAKVLKASTQYREAAQQFIKAGEYEQAALMLEEAGDFYEAGKLFFQLGRTEDTISFLQKVDTHSEHYYEASLILGRIFMDRGMLDTAKERFKKLLAKKEISNENLGAFYSLAVIYEKNQEFDNALLLYDKILAENYKFKDVPERIKTVKKSLQENILDTDTAKTVESPAGSTRYRIIKKIGQGGMGVVYKAQDTLLNRIVAFKVLPPSLSDNPTMLESFLREARVAAGINHINIVTIYDTGAEGAEPYIVMELVEGVSLKQILEKTTSMNTIDIIDVIKQVCHGLDHAHGKNVVHRDIKPANIMIRKDRVVKIMDFGLAKVLTSASQEGTSVKGTPLYMSPEQIRGERADHRTDVYSLGCTMYRMATGRPPFLDGDVYYHHLNTDPIPPRVKNPRIPGYLEQVIMKCLEKSPTNRYQSAKEVLDILESNS